MGPFPAYVPIRHQRRTALLGALLVLPFAALDVMDARSGAALALALGARASWALALLVGVALLSRPSPRFGAAAVLMAGANAAATGGARSGYLPFLLTLGLCMVILLPGHVMAALASGAAGIVAGASFLAAGGTPTADILRWAGTGVALAGLAVYGTHVGGIILRRELDRAREAAEASNALALSEKRRASVERLALVGRLAAGVAHEVNNPLGYVKANLSYVRSELAAPEQADRGEIDSALGEAAIGVDRIGRIVADLRGFAREDGDEPCGTSVPGALADALRLASVRTKGIRIEVDAREDLARGRICRKRLVQVLLNLLVNAADAIAEARRGAGERWISVRAREDQDGVAVRVEDSGRGIPPEALPRLFDPFFTTKPAGAGTGLGLALSHEYVHAVGGRILASNGKRGAVFEVWIPRQASAPGCTSCSRAEPAAPSPRSAAAS